VRKNEIWLSVIPEKVLIIIKITKMVEEIEKNQIMFKKRREIILRII